MLGSGVREQATEKYSDGFSREACSYRWRDTQRSLFAERRNIDPIAAPTLRLYVARATLLCCNGNIEE